MNESAADSIRERVDAVYRKESRRVFATLIRRLGDFDLAEEALHDAFRAALEQWPQKGEPANPRVWLITDGPSVRSFNAGGALTRGCFESRRRRRHARLTGGGPGVDR